MDAALKGVLSGVAIGGLVTLMMEANKMTLQALWRANILAAQTALDILTAHNLRERLKEAGEAAAQAREAAAQEQTATAHTDEV